MTKIRSEIEDKVYEFERDMDKKGYQGRDIFDLDILIEALEQWYLSKIPKKKEIKQLSNASDCEYEARDNAVGFNQCREVMLDTKRIPDEAKDKVINLIKDS